MNVDEVLKLRSHGLRDDTSSRHRWLDDPAVLSGRTVLVTGAGGSIGSALCQEIAHLAPTRLVLLDRDDSALHTLRLRLEEVAQPPVLAYYLRDICDEEALRDVFSRERPQVALHAAALKHVPLLEEHPAEAYRVNVLGTRAALAAAAACSTEVFVNVSTDKASNPTTVLGLTKRLGERLTSYFGTAPNRRYVSVRFGNILGSRGSFLPTFVDQIEQGRPVTVTHEDATRFLMSIDDAVTFILHAVAEGRSGETLIADMGDPVRILDIANMLIADAGASLPIRITGLRPGDKLHEDYLDDSEAPTGSDRAAVGVTRVRVKPVDPESLRLDYFLKSISRQRSLST
jgi:FlaA1/EpsC-like NDP-sugar epimerase